MNRHDIEFPAKHAALREDVHALGVLMGELLREQGGNDLYDVVEQDRLAAIARRGGDAAASAKLAARVQGRPPAVARDLERAFTMWFQAVNVAEQVHRIRRRREYFLRESGKPQPGGVLDALGQFKNQGLSLPQLLSLLGQVRIEPVFTAHPTESTRRTILRKQQHIADLLLDRLDPTLTPDEQRNVWRQVRREFTTGWQTEDHPRERLTVADEREHVVFYLAEVLYHILPMFYEEIGQALQTLYGVPADTIELPTIIRFGTWVGGDMDGSPDVHAKSIRDTLARQQQVIVNAYHLECLELAQKLSQSASRASISTELQRQIENYSVMMPGARSGTPTRHDRMPYRVFLGQVAERLKLTWDHRPNGYESAQQLRRDIALVADSLKANRGTHAGYTPVSRLLRRIDTFGFHLATLDVRQHAQVHHEVIARGLDDPQWLQRPPSERHALLADALECDRGPRAEFDALGKRTLGVFDAIMQSRHRYGAAAVGYYIVSDVADADDVLAPLLLARWAEAYDRTTGEVAIDIAPLFESVTSLQRAGVIMAALLTDKLYQRHLDARSRQQCVLVGYSDSCKDGGLCASRVAVYRAQQGLSDALREAQDRPVIFHARGGSIARGGGRIDGVVRATPPGTLSGILRLTEQGEGISQSYGLRPIAMRTLERAFHALTLASAPSSTANAPGAAGSMELALANTLAAASQQHYRELVWEDPQFLDYFRQATPIDVIERMQIGSRPAMREDRSGLEAMRAVPWVYAWTQSRLMVPGWYGAGTGLRAAIDAHGLAAVRDAYARWPFLRNLVDDVETMLARADLRIASHYDSLALPALHRYFDIASAEFALTCEQVLTIKERAALLDDDPTLQRAIALRNPYVDPMNLMQVDLLRRWRATERQDRDLFDALLASVGGIAQGLQSTG